MASHFLGVTEEWAGACMETPGIGSGGLRDRGEPTAFPRCTLSRMELGGSGRIQRDVFLRSTAGCRGTPPLLVMALRRARPGDNPGSRSNNSTGHGETKDGSGICLTKTGALTGDAGDGSHTTGVLKAPLVVHKAFDLGCIQPWGACRRLQVALPSPRHLTWVAGILGFWHHHRLAQKHHSRQGNFRQCLPTSIAPRPSAPDLCDRSEAAVEVDLLDSPMWNRLSSSRRSQRPLSPTQGCSRW